MSLKNNFLFGLNQKNMNPIEESLRKQARSLFKCDHVNAISLKGDDLGTYIVVVGLEKDNCSLPSFLDFVHGEGKQIVKIPIEKEIHGPIVPYNESIKEIIRKQSNCLFLNQNVVSISLKGNDRESYFLDVGLKSDDQSLPTHLDVDLLDRIVKIPVHKKVSGKIVSY